MKPRRQSLWQWRRKFLILVPLSLIVTLDNFHLLELLKLGEAVPLTSPKDNSTRLIANQLSDHSLLGYSRSHSYNNTFVGVKARAFDKWEQIPCFPPSDNKPKTQGIIYLKLQKTGSSTAVGITARIARNQASRRRINNATKTTFQSSCATHLDHSLAHKLCPHRNRHESFLFTTLREPTSRFLSSFFFFQVSIKKEEPSDEAFMQRVNTATRRKKSGGGHYLKRLSTKPPIEALENPTQSLDEILNEYDFIGITERMEESTVALAMLANLPLAHVLYLDAKRNGGYYARPRACDFLVPSFVSPGMEMIMKSDDFESMIQWDRALYQAANRSLDLTIDKILGRAKFEANLAKFRHAQDVARECCASFDLNNFCSTTGNGFMKTGPELGECLYRDMGCGFNCLNEVAHELNLW